MNILPPTASSALQATATAGRNADAANALTVKSAEAIAKALGLNAPQLIKTTVVGSGQLSESLIAKVRPDTAAMPGASANAIPAKPIPAQSLISAGKPTALAGPEAISGNIKAGDIWLKLAIAKAGTLLLTLPSKAAIGNSSKSHSLVQAEPPNIALPALIKGTRLNIILFPGGRVELPNAGAQTNNAATGRSHGLTGMANFAPAAPQTGTAQAGVTTPSQGVLRSFPAPLPNTPPAPPSATASALSQLINRLQNATGGLASLSDSSAAIQQLRDAVAVATPSIQNQLLPTKLLQSLEALRESLPGQSPPKEVAAAIEKALGTTGPNPLITHLQHALSTSQRLAQPHTTTPPILALLLKSLPGKTANHERIQESRANIAQWLSQELSSQITRMARQHAATANSFIDRQEPFHLQQELPVKLGDELTYMQLRIEEREPEQQNKGSRHPECASEEKRWSIFLTFDVPEAPPPWASDLSEPNTTQTTPRDTLSVEMTLIQQSVSIEFWCQQTELFQQVQGELKSLEQAMAESGLTLTQALCHQGKAPLKRTALTQSHANQRPLSQTRIDVKT
ncbi:MAG TPA: hypothetical protein VIC26_04755 [Marinagarivorans sp.]